MSSRRGVQQEGKTPEMSATDVLDFKALVGTVVEVRFKDSRQVKAEVFAYDSTARMVVLQERLPQVRRRNINVVRDTFISSIKVLGREERTDLSRPLPAIQYKYLTERENRALRKAQSAVASKGVGVSDRAQRVFDQFAKTYPCEWDGTTIVVMDFVRISDPYTAESCTCAPGNEAARDRIKKILTKMRA